MSDLNVSIIMRLINKVRAPAREVEADLERVRKKSAMLAGMGRVAARTVMVGSAAAGVAAANAVRQAATMEDAWSEANKTLELGPVALEQLKDRTEALAQTVPLATRDLVEMAGAAGQIGVRGRELLPFMEDAAKMAATFDVQAAESATIMGAWREQMGWTQERVRFFADQINYLGNTTNANSAQIAGFSTRVLKLADEAGMASETMLALGTAMIASGRAPEEAATSLRSTLTALTRSARGLTAAQKSVVEDLGLDWNAVMKRMSTDGKGALREVVAAISELPNEMRIDAARSLFGDEAQRGMQDLLSDVGALDQALSRVAGMDLAAGSMQAEFAALSDDVVDNWQRVKNALSARNVQAGDLLLSPLNEGLRQFASLVSTLDERVTVIDRVAAAWKGFAAGLGGMANTALAERIAVLSAALKGLVFGQAGEEAGDALARVFRRAEEAGQRLGGLRDTLRGFGDAVAELGGSATGAIATYVSGFFDGFRTTVDPLLARLRDVWEQVGPMLDNMRRIGKAIGGLFAGAEASPGTASALRSMGEFVGKLAGWAATGLATGMELTARALETLTGVIASLLERDWAGAGAEARGFLSWLADWSLPNLSGVGEGIGRALEGARGAVLAGLRTMLSFDWAMVLPKWDWGSIIPELPSFLRSMNSELAAELKDIADGRRLGQGTWFEGTRLIADLDAGKIALEAFRNEMEKFAALPDQSYSPTVDTAERAKELLAALEGVTAAARDMPSAAQVRAEAGQVEELQRKMEAVLKAAAVVPDAVDQAIREARRAVSALDMGAEGRQLMEAMAQGIRSGTAAVVAAMRNMTRQVNAALPSGPAVTLSANARPLPLQARASGGAFGPGYLLTGENGPELEYRSRGGFIAHNGELRAMLRMSDTIRRSVRQTPPVASPRLGAASPQRITIGDVHVHAPAGTSPMQIAQTVRAELARATRPSDDALHDGGFFDA